jgi:hypothetical protein
MLIKDKEILIGCDPEVFVFDTKKEKFIGAHGLIGGTKAAPLEVTNGMVQVDGMALEFGIAPARTEDEFFSNISSVMNTLQNMLPSHLELRVVPIVVFDDDVIDSAPPDALMLGCDPDYNAYTMEKNSPPMLSDPNMRSAGGHVHVGWCKGVDAESKQHLTACAALTAVMDRNLGVPSLYWDKDSTRRQIYGKAGAFRPKPYGMEYRTLSNQWLLSEEYIRVVYRRTIESVKDCLNDNLLSIKPVKVYDRYPLASQYIIDNNMTAVGEDFYERFCTI